MKKIVNCILLVDDNEEDNYFHKRIIDKSGKVNLVRTAMDGVEAIKYLNNEGEFADRHENPRPNIIFLDINMPKMNGFEFLREYKKIDKNHVAEICIIMLTTSKNPDDFEKAKIMGEVTNYITKPLSEKSLLDVIDQYIDVVKQKTS